MQYLLVYLCKIILTILVKNIAVCESDVFIVNTNTCKMFSFFFIVYRFFNYTIIPAWKLQSKVTYLNDVLHACSKLCLRISKL